MGKRKITIIIEEDDDWNGNWDDVIVTPYRPVDIPWLPRPWTVPNEPIGKCPACGVDLHQVMMYYCPRYPCPSGLGGAGYLSGTVWSG